MEIEDLKYKDFKNLRIEYDKYRYEHPIMSPKDGDQLRGIRRDFNLLQFLLIKLKEMSQEEKNKQ